MNSSDKEKEEPKIFMKGTLEWNEYLEKHPDRKREEQMKDEENTQALVDSFKPFNDFKDKVRALGKERMEIESIKTEPGYKSSFHSEHYRMALLDLVTESFIEQIRTEDGFNHWIGKTYIPTMFDSEIEKIKRAQEEVGDI
jgi:uncharacterized protein with von Willebrand factor type A (vWA) domain